MLSLGRFFGALALLGVAGLRSEQVTVTEAVIQSQAAAVDASAQAGDIAVVDAHLFLNMFEFAFEVTNGWKDVAKFSNDSNARAARTDFLRYLSKGIIRPDLMPSSPEKAEWSNFFGKLGDKYASFCCGISVGVYARESFMAAKQETAIQKFLANEVTI